MTENFLLVEPDTHFPYRMEKVAGEGAMGVVYRALDETLNRPVAIKILRDEDNPSEGDREQRQRFLQEARAAAALSHPGVTTVHQIGELRGAPYIVMEWLEGQTVEDMIARHGAVTTGRATRYLHDLLEVLGFAHRAGVVHRDIKPSNLVVLEDDRLKVTDFGIAFLQEQSLVQTAAGSVLATPRYASPEQLQGQQVDGRSDLFSAALVYYQLLTADLPWDGKSFGALLRSLFERPPTPVRTHQPHLPAALDEWFRQALSVDRDLRFRDARSMSEALRRIFDRPIASARTEPLRKTHPLPPPMALFEAPEARNVGPALLHMIASWPARELGPMHRESLIEKLLDQPLHADPFAGAARFGGSVLLVENGMILGILDLEDGALTPDAELPERSDAVLHALPPSHTAGLVKLLASALSPGEPRHAGLDTETVHLPAFAGKLLAGGFEGVLRLDGATGSAWVLMTAQKTALALMIGNWPDRPQDQSWEDWLESTPMEATFYDVSVRPPDLWFRHAFRDAEIQVVPAATGIPLDGASRALSEVIRTQVQGPLFHPLDETSGTSPSGESVSACSSPMSCFLMFLLEELPKILVERNQSAAWKYLGDWILLIRKARIYAELDRPKQEVRDAFDLVTEDGTGKVLHLACRVADASPQVFDEFVQKVIAAKEARKDRGDIGGAFLIAPSFSPEVLDAYRSMLHKGLGNRLLGLDKSMGYEGFIRLTSRRGFHLLLVQEKDGQFQPHFVT